MTDFRPIIRSAYQEILEREADASGLEHYNERMNAGLAEADLREILLRSEEYDRTHQGFRPQVIGRGFNFDYFGYTSFGLLGRTLEERVRWVNRGIAEGVVVFRVFSDTSFWPPDPLLDQVLKHRAVDASGRHPSEEHIRVVEETLREAFVPPRAVMEYVILVTQFEERGPLFRRFPETESYVFEVMARLAGLPNVIFELGNEVDIQGKGWDPNRVNRVLSEVRRRWPQVIISCSSGVEPQPAYGAYIYPQASWANIHYPRRDFPALSFGWPFFGGPVVNDEPQRYPGPSIDDYSTHLRLVQEQNGFMTTHTEAGFICDPEDGSDIPLLRELQRLL
jgi:hypothetical protein